MLNQTAHLKQKRLENNQKKNILVIFFIYSNSLALLHAHTHTHAQILTASKCLASSTLLFSTSCRKRCDAGVKQEKWFASRSAIALTATVTSTYRSLFDFQCWASTRLWIAHVLSHAYIVSSCLSGCLTLV